MPASVAITALVLRILLWSIRCPIWRSAGGLWPRWTANLGYSDYLPQWPAASGLMPAGAGDFLVVCGLLRFARSGSFHPVRQIRKGPEPSAPASPLQSVSLDACYAEPSHPETQNQTAMNDFFSHELLQGYWWLMISVLGSLWSVLCYQWGQSILYTIAVRTESALLGESAGRSGCFPSHLVTFGGAFFAPSRYSTYQLRGGILVVVAHPFFFCHSGRILRVPHQTRQLFWDADRLSYSYLSTGYWDLLLGRCFHFFVGRPLLLMT
jgi:hypothetical protein